MTLLSDDTDTITLQKDASRLPLNVARIVAAAIVSTVLSFLITLFFTLGYDWHPLREIVSRLGSDLSPPGAWDVVLMQAVILSLIYLLPFLLLVISNFRKSPDCSENDAIRYESLSSFIIRFGFWSVALIGVADVLISLLRVEDWLESIVGHQMSISLGLSNFRAVMLHLPLIAVSGIIALFTRSTSVIWLSLLVVLSEFTIVIARFVFSYEQAFMGDLVRFWYSALFLLAAGYCLAEDEHVRVDIFYAKHGRKGKAVTNAIGTLVLGLPFLWIILIKGLGEKSSSLSVALLNFEISQSGFGMYVKYLMAGLLVVFAVSMIAQLAAVFMRNCAVLCRPNSVQTMRAGLRPADQSSPENTTSQG